MSPRGIIWIWIAGVFLTASVARAEQEPGVIPQSSIEECDILVRDDPDDIHSYACYWLVPQTNGEWGEAVRRLEALLALDPGNPRVLLYLALTRAFGGYGDVEDLYRSAITGFAGEAHPLGETWARESLAMYLAYYGRHDEAKEEFDRALVSARLADEPWLEVEVLSQAGWHRHQREEHGTAWLMLKRAESLMTPEMPLRVRLTVLDGLAGSLAGLGRVEEAFLAYQRELALLGDREKTRAAGIRANLALMAKGMHLRGLMGREEFLEIQRSALDAAVASGNRLAEARSHLGIAEQVPDDHVAIDHARAALAIAREVRNVRTTIWALVVLGERLVRTDPENPEAGLALNREAQALARDHGDLYWIAVAKRSSAASQRSAGRIDEAIADAVDAVETVERIRDLQIDPESRVRVFSRFGVPYRILADLHLHYSGGVEGVALGLDAMERYRARMLLDTLDAAGVTKTLESSDLRSVRRSELLGEIATVQRALLDPELPRVRRNELLASLERLEIEEAGLRAEIVRSHPELAAVRRPEIPDLRQIQKALAGDQAIIAYQIRQWSPGWAIAITRDSAEAVALPEGHDRRLATAVSHFLSLLERRDGAERPGAARLYDEILGDVLDRLPPGVTRLIIVPDFSLHHLPFGALRADPDGEPLVAMYDISLVPSITSWMRWKRGKSPDAPRAALVIADPTVPFEGRGEYRSAGVFAVGVRLGSLPYARREARAMSHHLGESTRVLIGDEATEQAIKTEDLSRFGVIHIAAHAMVDDESPERSAVLLAPGSAQEDGLLQFREIVDLDLDGHVVVLSACRSAGGPVMAGEGVMGLANAFFLAGANAVVAGLWPLRDDEVSLLVEAFARRLAGGGGVTSALSMAQRDRIRAGAPPAAWAGLVVLGDGDLVAVPGGRPGGASRWWGLIAPAALAFLAALVLAGRLRSPTRV